MVCGLLILILAWPFKGRKALFLFKKHNQTKHRYLYMGSSSCSFKKEKHWNKCFT